LKKESLFFVIKKEVKMTDPRLKELKIKVGVVRRIVKEKSMYEKEAIQIEKKVEKMKEDGKDEYDIRKMVNLFHLYLL
jgi:tubulin-specific chaperone A